MEREERVQRLVAAAEQYAAAHSGLERLGLVLDNRPGRYRRYLELIERCRDELADQGYEWSARQVDLALFQLGSRRNAEP